MAKIEGQDGWPERPISSSGEDRLDRKRFAARLVDGVISSETGKSTGVVIGVTGPWGSGKSSILNLVEERIREVHPAAHVVRFDPWLVSGRNDLITDFLRELLSTFNRANQIQRAIIEKIAKYAELLSPVSNLVALGSGPVVAGGAKALGAITSSAKSVAALKRSLFEELTELDEPVVVLIDELDRIEDAEIRTVAQLVRSVADFPGISYLIAYDARRVVQALGEGQGEVERAERGRAYLEKIVQFAFPLPIMLGGEMQTLLTSELLTLQKTLRLPQNFPQERRYKEVCSMLFENGISTPRDLKKLAGTFHVVASMVGGEVDWLDLLVLSAMMTKNPQTVELIRKRPDRYVVDPLSEREMMSAVASPKGDAMLGLIAPSEDNAEARNLLSYLFPRLGKDRNITYSDALSLRRPLLTALRFDLIPGAVSRQQVIEVASAPGEIVSAKLAAALQQDEFDALFERLRNLYPDVPGINHVVMWEGVADFLSSQDRHRLLLTRNIAESFAQLLHEGVDRQQQFRAAALDVFAMLQNRRDLILLPEMIRTQFFAHGAFGSRTVQEPMILSSEQVTPWGRELAQTWRERHLTRDLLPHLCDLDAVYVMQQASIWDQKCRDLFSEALDDAKLFENIVVMMFGGNRITESINSICDQGLFAQRAAERLQAGKFDGAIAGLEDALLRHQRKTGAG